MTSCSTSRIKMKFLGENYTTSSHKPSKDNVAVITSMPSLTNKKQVKSFIGMIDYLAKFSTRLSELAEPIRELPNDRVPFNCKPEHQQAFVQMKKEMANDPILVYYNHTEANYSADRCQHQKFWCLSITRFKTSVFCKQCSH